MLKADMIQVGDYSTRFMAQNSNAWASDPASGRSKVRLRAVTRVYQDSDFRKE